MAFQLLWCLLTVVFSGDITLSKVDMDPKGVQERATYEFFIVTVASLTPADATVRYVFPSQVQIEDDADYPCILMDNFKPTATCVANGNTVTVANALDGDLGAGTMIKIQFPNVVNPGSDDTTDHFLVQTLTLEGALIDEDANNLTVTAEPGALDAMGIVVDSINGNDIVGAESAWEFSIDPNHETPSDGKVKIYFPLWNFDLNPPDTRQIHFIPNGGTVCSGTVGTVNANIPCSYDQPTQMLTLTSVFTSSTQSTFKILVNPVKNPPSGKEMNGFIVRIMNDEEGTIELSDGTAGIQVSTPNSITIDTAKLLPLTSTTGSDSIWECSFTSTNPFGSGYEVEIEFPDKLTIDELEFVQGQTNINNAISFTRTDQVVRITGGYSEYVGDTDVEVTITFVQFTNYGTTEPLGKFYVRTYTSEGLVVDSGESPPDKQLDPNVVQQSGDWWISANDYSTSAFTEYTFSFAPTNLIPADGAITIIFPDQIVPSAQNGPCHHIQAGLSNSTTCKVVGQQLDILNGFDNEFSGGQISFSLNLVKNAISTKTSDSFTITTYSTQSLQYSIDTITTGITVTATPRSFTDVVVTPEAPIVTGSTSDYTFAITTSGEIPVGGYITIGFPDSVSITNIAEAESSCRTTDFAAPGSFTCDITSTSVAFRNLFDAPFEAGLITFELGPIQNPPTTELYQSFAVISYDSEGFKIDETSSGVGVQPDTPNTLRSATITPGSLENGASNTYSVNIISENAIPDQCKVKIVPPESVQFPLSPVCTSSSIHAVACTYDSGDRSVTAQMTIVNAPLAAGSVLNFEIEGVTNPGTTETTDDFKIYLNNSNSYGIDMLETGTTVTMTEPGNLTTIQISASDPLINAITTYTVLFTPINTHPVDTEIRVTVPSEIVLSDSISCGASIGTDLGLTCTRSPSSQEVTVVNALSQPVVPPSQLAFSISTISNPDVSLTTSPWIITTKTGSYEIDGTTTYTTQVTCSDPWASCQTVSTNCTSCSPTGTKPYFYEDSCHAACPSGQTDPGTITCETCNAVCLECSGAVDTCSECDTSGATPYLWNNTCNESCDNGFWGDGENCFACNDPCANCSGAGSDKCISCDTIDGEAAFLYNDGCQTTCPVDYRQNTVTNECEACKEECVRCADDAQVCTECVSGEKLYDTGCVEKCPLETHLDVDGTCVACTSPCSKCETTVTTCTECIADKYLHNATCIDSCPADTTIQIDLTCIDCTSPCATCSASVSTCTSCIDTYKLYGNVCLSECPADTTVTEGDNCVDCQDPCKYCAGTSDACTDCETGMFLYNSDCLTICPAETTISQPTSCQDCSDNCATCSGSIDFCKSCNDDDKLFENQCVPDCPVGTTIEQGDECIACSTNCQYCDGTTSNCTSCRDGNKLYNNQCVADCIAETTVQIGDACYDCAENCFTCETLSTTCTTCKNPQVLHFGICYDSCPTNFTEIAGKCVENDPYTECSPGCNSFLYENDNCDDVCNTEACNYDDTKCSRGELVCLSGTYEDGIECLACVDPCKTCSSQTSCDSCLVKNGAQWLLHSNTCYETCPTGTVRNGVICEDCAGNCSECVTNTTTCTACVTGTFLYNNTCDASCPVETTVANGQICEVCNASCTTCSGTTSTCTSCPSTTNLSSGTCVVFCPDGTTLVATDGNVCRDCFEDCQTCNGYVNVCTSCSGTRYLHNGQCLTSCPSGATIPSGNECIDCSSECVTCSGSPDICTTCIEGKSLYNGLCLESCPAGTELDGAECVVPTPPTECSAGCTELMIANDVCDAECNNNDCNYDNTLCLPSETCQAGKYRTGVECLDCVYPCNTCSSETVCTSCDAKAGESIQLLYYEGQCTEECPSNYMKSGITCQECNSSCLTCSGTVDTCITCPEGNLLYNGTCVNECPNDISVVNGSVCDSCSINCNTCQTTSTQCTTCNSGKLYYENDCHDACPDGSTLTADSGTNCLACSSSCKTCETTIANCTSCNTDKLTWGNNCLDECPANITVALGNMCVACQLPCLTCETTATQCLTCDGATVAMSGNCIDTCPVGYEPILGVCTALCAEGCTQELLNNSDCDIVCNTESCQYDNTVCDANNSADCGFGKFRDGTVCADCVYPCKYCVSTSSCTACAQHETTAEQLLLNDDQCIDACPDGTIANGLVCDTCNDNCLTCVSTTTTCTTCHEGFSLYNNQCQNGCSVGSQISVDGVCVSCNVNCISCLNTIDYCTECATGAVLNGNSCVSQCSDGFTTTDASGGVCLPCSSNCETCLSEVTRCLTCPSTKVFHLNTCLDSCPSGYTAETENPTICAACIGCAECTQKATQCTSCAAGTILNSADKCQEAPTCPDGMTLTADSGVSCINCDTTCLTCADTTTNCTSCTAQGILSDGTCTPCTNNCKTCSGTTDTCLSCPSGYVLQTDECVQCAFPCLSCETNTSTCTACQDELMLNGNQCLPCDNSCRTCVGTEANECSSCEAPRVLYQNQCFACDQACETCNGPNDNQCLSCEPGKTLVNNQCVVCEPTCKTCNGPTKVDCMSCGTGKTLVEGQCVICNPTCETCFGDEEDKCLTCEAPRALFQNQCIICHSSCLTCDGTTDQNCLSCAEDKTIVGKSCVQCHNSCLSCDGSLDSNCLSCVSSRALVNNVCVPCDVTCLTCTGSGNENCLTCDPGKSVIQGRCLTCDATCLSCQGANANECLTCYDFHALKGGYCIRCHEDCTTCTGELQNECFSCTAPRNLVAGYCVICHYTCDACDGPLETDCITCPDQHTLVDGACVRCDNTCVTCTNSAVNNCLTCRDGDYLVNGACQGCIENCKTCENDPSECTTCNDGTYLQDFYCLDCSTTCLTCEGDKFHCTGCAENLVLVNNVCEACSHNCLTCVDSVTYCTSCNPRMTLLENQCFNCHSSCERCEGGDPQVCSECQTDHQFILDNHCVECDSLCQTCETTSDNCTSCEEGYGQIGTTCLKCDDNCVDCSIDVSVCTKCKDGQDLSAGRCVAQCNENQYKSGDVCITCDSSCLTCQDNPLNCLTCFNQEYVLSSGACLEQCPDGEYADEKECKDCQETCATCVEPDICTGCPIGWQLDDFGICVEICLVSQYLGPNGVCINCNSNCLSCASSKDNCTACPEGQVLNGDNKCEVPCESGYTRTPTSNEQCLKCAVQCKECSNQIDNCIACVEGEYTYNGDCLETCPPGNTVSTDTACVDCHSSCVTCTISSTTCVTCQADKVFFNAECIDECPYGYENRSGTCSACADPTNCPYVEPEPEPVTEPFGGNTTTARVDTTSDDDEEFEEGPLPFPFSGAEIVTTGGIILSKVAAPLSSATSAMNVVSGVWASISWINMAGNFPSATEDHQDDRRLLFELSTSDDNKTPTYTFLFLCAALALHFGCNIVFFLIYVFAIRKDERFTLWRQYHNCTSVFTPTISLIFSFHCYRLYICGFMNLKACQAQFSNIRPFYLTMIRMTYFHMIFVVLTVGGCCIASMNYFNIDEIIWMLSLDALFVCTTLLIFLFMDNRAMEKAVNEDEIHNKLAIHPSDDLNTIFHGKMSAPDNSMEIDTSSKKNLTPANDSTILEDEDARVVIAMQKEQKQITARPISQSALVLDDLQPQASEMVMMTEEAANTTESSLDTDGMQRLEDYPIGTTRLQDLDMDRAIPDELNPEIITVPYKLIKERIAVHWPFDNSVPADEPQAEFMFNRDHFNLEETVIDEFDATVGILRKHNGKEVRLRRQAQELQVVDIEPKIDSPNIDLIGLVITDDSMIDLTGARNDTENSSLVLCRHVETGEQVIVRKSFHKAQCTGKRETVDIFRTSRIEVNPEDPHFATVTTTEGRMLVAKRTFIGAKIISLYSAETVRDSINSNLFEPEPPASPTRAIMTSQSQSMEFSPQEEFVSRPSYPGASESPYAIKAQLRTMSARPNRRSAEQIYEDPNEQLFVATGNKFRLDERSSSVRDAQVHAENSH